MLVFLAVMNSVLNPALHSALRGETQCHAPPSRWRLGLQVASCLPVFCSSGTAGAINQSPPAPQFTPNVSVCESLTSNTAVQGCLIWSSGEGDTFVCLFLSLFWFVFADFLGQSRLTFSRRSIDSSGMSTSDLRGHF